MKKGELLEVVGKLRCDTYKELHTVKKVADRRYRFRYIMACPKGKCGILFTQEAFDYAKRHGDYFPVSSFVPLNTSLTLTTGSEGENSR
jgi:hypothetical protein